MNKLLGQLGRWCFANRWIVIGAWLIILCSLGLAAAANYIPTSSAIVIPGTQAQKAITELATDFPMAGRGQGRIVFYASKGHVADYQGEIVDGLSQITKINGVTAIISPFAYTKEISSDSRTAYAQVQLKQQGDEISPQTLNQIQSGIKALSRPGLEVEYGGDLISNVPSKILGPTETLGLLIALATLLITFGSLIAASLPLANALVAVGSSMAGLFALSHIVSINSTTPALSVMLGLAVGIDYSLFIISKYRSELLLGRSETDAVERALASAGRAVVFAAGTVVIALSALSVVRIPFMTIMGVSAAAAVATSALVALTLTPACFGLFGQRIFKGITAQLITRARQLPAEALLITTQRPSRWREWAEAVTARPWLVLIPGVLIMGYVALPVAQLRLGLPSDEYAAANTTQAKAYSLLTKAFGPGYNAPLTILVKHIPPATPAERALVQRQLAVAYEQQSVAQAAVQNANLAARAATVRNEAQAVALQKAVAAAKEAAQAAKTQFNQQIVEASGLFELNLIAQHMIELSNVAAATPGIVSADGSTGVIQLVPKSGPSDAATTALIAYLRSHQAAAAGNSAVTLEVTGATALQDDIGTKLAAALPVYVAVIAVLSLILLFIAFRSIIIPIKATLAFVLSVLAMFGAIVAVFQWGWLGLAPPGPIVSFVPIIGVGVLFGLAMDYEFFLVTSMHEAYASGQDSKQAIISGFTLGGKVVMAAATIMAAVFAGFIGNDDVTIKTLGFGLAAGVFMDAFIVRLMIVPAVMAILGDFAWWLPQSLHKNNQTIVPTVPGLQATGPAIRPTATQSRGRAVSASSAPVPILVLPQPKMPSPSSQPNGAASPNSQKPFPNPPSQTSQPPPPHA